ncbi:MAG TPA: HAD family hydrolase [Halobacteriales archaeon]|nr:HAD family hydrolase [Halobacteriales archaeon]
MAPPTYDFWLLDLDGTLVDVERGYKRELLTEVGDHLGVSFADPEVTRVWHGSTAHRRGVLESKGLGERQFWTVFDELDDPEARVEATYLYGDAAVVRGLDAPTGIVTHCPAPITERVLAHLDIRDWFDTVVCCDETLGWKPDPAPIRKGISGLSVAGNGNGTVGVYAGDGPHDIGAAWNAGLDGIHVDRHDAALRGEYVLADRSVRAFTDLLA